VENRLRDLFHDATELEQGSFFEYGIRGCIRRFCTFGTGAIDVGANGGAHTLTMAQCVGRRGHVYAFEPDPTIAGKIVDLRTSYPWVELFPLALSDRTGEQTFYLDQCTALSSLHQRPNRPTSIQGQLTVPISRLDDVAALGGARDIRLIKADIEGEELRFLEGAEHTIKAHRPIVLLEIDWAFAFGINEARFAAGEHEIEAARFLDRLRRYAGGYVMLDFFGSVVDAYDPWSWNVALVPHDFDITSVQALLKQSGETFFRECRSWTLY
jgi:FkbM family methyltransferase